MNVVQDRFYGGQNRLLIYEQRLFEDQNPNKR